MQVICFHNHIKLLYVDILFTDSKTLKYKYLSQSGH